MEMGLIGLPLCGKTTIFNALTGRSGPPGNRKQSNLAEVAVPDQRVGALAACFKPKKKVWATVRFKDLQVDFSEQGGLAAGTLGETRDSDALAIILRTFLDEAVYHPLKTIDPRRDLLKILESLILSDYEVVERRRERLSKEAKQDSREYQLLSRLSQTLSSGSLPGADFLSPEEEQLLSGYRFLTLKPIMVVANTGGSSVEISGLAAECQGLNLELLSLQGLQEMEIAQLAEEDQREFLEDLGLKGSTKNRFLKQIYSSLDLISFLTVGDKEVRAWSIPRGSTALQAAAKVHTDMEKGFIRAETIQWQELLDAGGYAAARKSGTLRLEGKDYRVQDGDVLLIRFNV